MENLTVDAWLSELENIMLSGLDGSGMSMEELSEAAGISKRTMGERLRKAQRLGILRVEYRKGMSLMGRATRIPVYTLLPRKE